MTKNAIFKSTILSQPTTRIQTRTHTHTHTHGIRGASICVKSLVDRDIYTNRVLLDPKTCATILSQRDLFFYVKKKKKKLYTYLVVRIVGNYGCICLAKTQRVIEQRLYQLIFTLFIFLLLCIRFLVTKFLEEEYIRRLS